MKDWAGKYETAAFIENDPVQIPHRYDSRVNIEISAFITSWIAFGNRKQIIQKADFIDQIIFEGSPYHYIVGDFAVGGTQKWRQYKESNENFYRFFKYSDFHDICERLFDIYTNFENMEEALKANTDDTKTALAKLQTMFGEVAGIPDETGVSACKRLCLFLRWMCRHNSPVDFGLWTICDPKNLIIPLDTHVHAQALTLGLTERKTPDIITAIEITDKFAAIFPDDPTKGDFALFGYSVDPDAPKIDLDNKRVDDMSVADVFKHKLFLVVCKKEISDIWNQRETARKKVAKEGQRLKAHPIDQLHRDGYLNPETFVLTYAKIYDKINVGLSRTQRDVIQTIGNTAFHKTMRQLIDTEAENEKTGNKRKRKNNKRG